MVIFSNMVKATIMEIKESMPGICIFDLSIFAQDLEEAGKRLKTATVNFTGAENLIKSYYRNTIILKKSITQKMSFQKCSTGAPYESPLVKVLGNSTRGKRSMGANRG